MNDLIQKFLFFGMTKEQAKGAWMIAYRFAIVFGVGAGWGWFSAIGVPNFAIASEVNARIEASSSAVLLKLRDQEQSLKSTVELLNRQLASTVATQIRSQAVKRCKARGGEDREQANREIDRLQEEYAVYRGQSYAIPSCGNL